MIPKVYLSLLTFLLFLTGCGEAHNQPSPKGGNETQDMLDAAEAGDLDAIKKLIDNGVSVNGLGDDQSTALHFAAQEGHVDVAKLLIEKGAEINATTDEGFGGTPLDVAKGDLVDLIKQNGGKTFAEINK